MKRRVMRAAEPLWQLLGWLIPKSRRLLAINAFPDFDDSTRALALALRDTGRTLVILTTRRQIAPPAWLSGLPVTIAYRYSLRGVFFYHRAGWVIFTHGCFSAWTPSPRQTVVNIWHGMPIKRIGLYDGKEPEDLPRFHYTIAQDARFQGIMAGAFGVDRDQVLIAEHPRIDMLRGDSGAVTAAFPPHERLLVWLPTYRASVTGDVRIDGDEDASIFADPSRLARIDVLCRTHRVLCLVKPHPMARVDPRVFEGFRALVLVDDDDLRWRGLSLYELLAASDLLITDVSSVYFDYKALRRPVLLYCPDLRAYAATRGFVAPIETLVTDVILESEEALLAALEAQFLGVPKGARVETDGPSAALELLRRIGVPPLVAGAR